MITERVSNPDNYSEPVEAPPPIAKLIRRVEFISRNQRRVQPTIDTDTLLQAVDEVIVDYASGRHLRTAATEKAIDEARALIHATTPDPWASRAPVVVP